ncbi:MAG: hypothetical protein KGJ62_00450 [Armatimonadetes bacterium]|nr:hypothetical protein [Armatimonadota bacterium]MDE2205186.1 hypothetical protein [Armatimonadota bacterium]
MSELVPIALRNTCDVANSIVPAEVPGYAAHIKPMSLDPVAFRQDQPEVADVAQVIAAQLKTNLGTTLQLKPMEWTQLLQERLQKTLAIYIIRWAADYLDPQDFLSVLLHTNRLINGQEDHPEAVNELPWVPLYFRRALELDKPRLHGIRDSVFGHLPHTATWVSG